MIIFYVSNHKISKKTLSTCLSFCFLQSTNTSRDAQNEWLPYHKHVCGALRAPVLCFKRRRNRRANMSHVEVIDRCQCYVTMTFTCATARIKLKLSPPIAKGRATSRRWKQENAGENKVHRSINEAHWTLRLLHIACVKQCVECVHGMFSFWASSCQGKLLKILQVHSHLTYWVTVYHTGY